MTEFHGPIGFRHIETAPRDGSFVRLRFGGLYEGREQIGRWQSHQHMKAGGAWFDRAGFYISPGPLFWKPGA